VAQVYPRALGSLRLLRLAGLHKLYIFGNKPPKKKSELKKDEVSKQLRMPCKWELNEYRFSTVVKSTG
jgi:hypothetical protein